MCNKFYGFPSKQLEFFFRVKVESKFCWSPPIPADCYQMEMGQNSWCKPNKVRALKAISTLHRILPHSRIPDLTRNIMLKIQDDRQKDKEQQLSRCIYWNAW